MAIPKVRFRIVITLPIGRNSKDCRKFGICTKSGSVTPIINAPGTRSILNITESTTGTASATIKFLSLAPYSDCGEDFIVETNVTLPMELSLFYPFKSVVILPGTYKFNPFASKFGEVIDVNVQIA